MKILGIETSCDETAAAVVEDGVKILSHAVVSSVTLHQKTGGVIPEVAAREQVKYIIPVINEALRSSTRGVDGLGLVDTIAVTVGPGLVGSLLVGVETAKTLAYVWQKPLIPVNHLVGHIYANWLIADIEFPALVLVVSGGHTDLVLMKGHQKLKWLGGTRDDAAGEAFDKIARLLGLFYPGGPAIAAEAAKFRMQNAKFRMFPRAMINDDNFDFSFSGLKTAVFREVNKLKTMGQWDNEIMEQLAYEVQEAIIDVLVVKTLRAAQKFKVKSILLSGGVGANDLLRKTLEVSSQQLGVKFFKPSKNLCTDNAAMIAAAAFFNYKEVSWSKIKVNPSLHF